MRPMPTEITAAAAADRAGVSRSTITRAIASGALRARKIGPAHTHPWVITLADLNRWVGMRNRSEAA